MKSWSLIPPFEGGGLFGWAGEGEVERLFASGDFDRLAIAFGICWNLVRRLLFVFGGLSLAVESLAGACRRARRAGLNRGFELTYLCLLGFEPAVDDARGKGGVAVHRFEYDAAIFQWLAVVGDRADDLGVLALAATDEQRGDNYSCK